MHDDIGARLTQWLLAAAEKPVAKSSEHGARIAAEAREIIASLDQIVWAVNPLTIGGFAEYLNIHAGRYLATARILLRENIALSDRAGR